MRSLSFVLGKIQSKAIYLLMVAAMVAILTSCTAIQQNSEHSRDILNTNDSEVNEVEKQTTESSELPVANTSEDQELKSLPKEENTNYEAFENSGLKHGVFKSIELTD